MSAQERDVCPQEGNMFMLMIVQGILPVIFPISILRATDTFFFSTLRQDHEGKGWEVHVGSQVGLESSVCVKRVSLGK